MTASKRQARNSIPVATAAIITSLAGWCSLADADSSPPIPGSLIHGFYWKHSAVISPVAGDIPRSVAIEGNAGTDSPPLAAIGGPEGIKVYAFKSLIENTPPAWHKEATLPGENASFSGSRLAIGTPANSPSVQVYSRTSTGAWNAMGLPLFPPGQVAAEEFGRSIELDGNTLVVGLPKNTIGRAYIFELERNAWVQTAELGLEPRIGITSSHFGGTVGVSGAYVAIGQLPSNDPGSVYLYHKDGGVWSVSQKLTARNPADPTQPALAFDFSATNFGKTFEIHGTQLAIRSNGYLQMFDHDSVSSDWIYRETFVSGPTAVFFSGRDLRSVAFDGANLLIGEPLAKKNNVAGGRVRPLIGAHAFPVFPVADLPGQPTDFSIWENPVEADVEFGGMTATDGGWLIVGDNDHARIYRKTVY